MKNTEEMKTINPNTFVSEYGNIRATYDNDDGILFVAVDVAKAFGIGSSHAADYCRNPRKHRLEVWDGDRLKTIVTAAFITPDDCMQLYYASRLRLEDRAAIKDLIFEEIIPALSETQKGYPQFRESIGKVPSLPARSKSEDTETTIERLTRRNRELKQCLSDILDCCQRNFGKDEV